MKPKVSGASGSMSELETWNVQRAYVRPSTTKTHIEPAEGSFVVFDSRWVNNGWRRHWETLSAVCEDRSRLLRNVRPS